MADRNVPGFGSSHAAAAARCAGPSLSADLPMLMRIDDLPARYRKHFLGD